MTLDKKMVNGLDVSQQITDFIKLSEGLAISSFNSKEVRVKQQIDHKEISILLDSVDEVISRVDKDNFKFLQVNFECGKKLILTHSLIGFKPTPLDSLDMDKLPKVVTTPDLISVIEVLEEAMNTESCHPVEVEVLRHVFIAVLEGGEAIGFNLAKERTWLDRVTRVKSNASA